MQAAMAASAWAGMASSRLVQVAGKNRSIALYTRLGFATPGALSVMNGAPLGLALPGHAVRAATAADRAACNALCHRVHGFACDGELAAGSPATRPGWASSRTASARARST